MIYIIPARYGSKGLKDKNIRVLGDKPLCAWSIETALALTKAENVFVISNDERVNEIASSYQLDLSYKRPSDYAQDNSSMFDAIHHFLTWYSHARQITDVNFALLQPSNPFRIHKEIETAVQIFTEESCKFLVGVTAPNQSPYEIIELKNGQAEYIIPQIKTPTNRHFYERQFRFISGALYLSSFSNITESRTIFDLSNTYCHTLSEISAIDIDNAFDFSIAQAIAQNILKEEITYGLKQPETERV